MPAIPTAGRERIAVGGLALELEVLDDDDVLDALIAEGADADARNPYFGRVWPSATALAALVAARGRLRGLRVLDLGCGTGLVGIVAARLGGAVTFADVMPEALELAARNAAANGVGGRLLELDLRAPHPSGRFDVVLAADLLYEPWLPPALASALVELLAPRGTALVADPHRAYADAFPRHVISAGLSMRLIDSQPPVRVWEAAR